MRSLCPLFRCRSALPRSRASPSPTESRFTSKLKPNTRVYAACRTGYSISGGGILEDATEVATSDLVEAAKLASSQHPKSRSYAFGIHQLMSAIRHVWRGRWPLDGALPLMGFWKRNGGPPGSDTAALRTRLDAIAARGKVDETSGGGSGKSLQPGKINRRFWTPFEVPPENDRE